MTEGDDVIVRPEIPSDEEWEKVLGENGERIEPLMREVVEARLSQARQALADALGVDVDLIGIITIPIFVGADYGAALTENVSHAEAARILLSGARLHAEAAVADVMFPSPGGKVH